MVSTSETGHAKNVANFDELISFVIVYGTAYNPSKASICLPELQNLSIRSKNAIDTVNATYPAYTNAVAAREAAFAPLSKLITRVVNALKATDTTDQVIESAKTLAHKIQGTRAIHKRTDKEKKVDDVAGKDVVEISSSQMSYDSRLDNFDKLIKLLSRVTLYIPNEADLKVIALSILYNELKTKNTDVVNATTPLSSARIARNDVLYKNITGLLDIAADIKTYIKSVFGATGAQYKQVSRLKFTKPR